MCIGKVSSRFNRCRAILADFQLCTVLRLLLTRTVLIEFDIAAKIPLSSHHQTIRFLDCFLIQCYNLLGHGLCLECLSCNFILPDDADLVPYFWELFSILLLRNLRNLLYLIVPYPT